MSSKASDVQCNKCWLWYPADIYHGGADCIPRPKPDYSNIHQSTFGLGLERAIADVNTEAPPDEVQRRTIRAIDRHLAPTLALMDRLAALAKQAKHGPPGINTCARCKALTDYEAHKKER